MMKFPSRFVGSRMPSNPHAPVGAVALLLAIGLAACTPSSQSSPASSSQPSPADVSQAANFDQTAVTASNAVTQYRQASTAAVTQANCTAALQQYVAAMQPVLDEMRSSAGPMDSYMKSAGNMMAGDMECGVQVMADELAHHQAVACTSTDMNVNRTEAQRHAEAMQSFADHMEMRAVQAGGMMGDRGQMMDAGWMAGWSDGGWMMPGGGMTAFDQAMPGCTYAGGGYQAPDGGYWMDGGWVMGSPGSMMDGGAGPMVDGGSMMGGASAR